MGLWHFAFLSFENFSFLFTPCSNVSQSWNGYILVSNGNLFFTGVWPTRRGGITCGHPRSSLKRILASTPWSWAVSQTLTMNYEMPSLTLTLVSSNLGACQQFKQQMLLDPRCCWMPSARPSLLDLVPKQPWGFLCLIVHVPCLLIYLHPKGQSQV